MKYKQIIFSGHAVRQMFRRNLNKNNVLKVIKNGEVIIDYPEDKPFPSCLILSFIDDRPVHVVFAMDNNKQRGIVVTAYIPDPQFWAEDFKTRRK